MFWFWLCKISPRSKQHQCTAMSANAKRRKVMLGLGIGIPALIVVVIIVVIVYFLVVKKTRSKPAPDSPQNLISQTLYSGGGGQQVGVPAIIHGGDQTFLSGLLVQYCAD